MKPNFLRTFIGRIGLPAIPGLVTATASAQLTLDLTVEAIHWPGYSGGVQYRATVTLDGTVPTGFTTAGNLLSADNLWAVMWGFSQSQSYNSLAALKAGLAASSPWTLNFDEGEPSAYTATIPLDVSGLQDSDVPPMAITTPPDGATGVSPTTSISWSAPSGYASGPGYIVDAAATALVLEYTGALGPGVTTWTPPAPLGSGVWSALVSYSKAAPAGTGFQVAVGDTSLMTAYSNLKNSAFGQFGVVPEPSVWATLAGVGLVAFGAVRRFASPRRIQ